MINHLTIQNFKSLHDVSVDFKPLTVIIGPNASGKSNLLDALEAIQRLVQYKGTTMPGRDGLQPTISVDALLWRKADAIAEISWQLHSELRSDENQTDSSLIEYTLSLKNASIEEEEEKLPIVTQEKLILNGENQSEAQAFFSRREDDITIQQSNGNFVTEILPTDLALHFYAHKSLPAVHNLHRYIQKWQFVKIMPQIIRRHASVPHPVAQRGKSRHLVKDGSNLANVLHYLREDQPDDFEYIQDEMRTTLGFSRLDTKEEDDSRLFRQGRVYLEAEEEVFAGSKPFGPENLSDGTLGLLALLTVLSLSEPAPLICLEEPERSIHLHLIPRLAHYLHEAAHHTQLIVTTHSPEFLDHFDPYEQEYVQVLIATRDEEGATQFVPIREIENVQEWLEDYMLGQIWTMGQIEEMVEA